MDAIPAVAPADDLKRQGVYFHESTITDYSAPTSSSPTNIRPRTAQACDKCRERKTKCSGEKPTCHRCTNRGLLCHYSARANRGKQTGGSTTPPNGEVEENVHSRKRERAPVVDSAAGPTESLLYPSITRSVPNSANAFKPYPVSRSQTPRSNGAYISQAGSRYQTVQAPPAPDAGTMSASNHAPNGYEYRPVAAPSTRVPSHPYAERGSHEQLSDCQTASWNMSYGMPTLKEPIATRLAKVDNLQLERFPDRDIPPRTIRTSFSSSSESLSQSRGQPKGYHNTGLATTHNQERGTTSYNTPFYATTPSFLEFPESFSTIEAPSSSSGKWTSDTSHDSLPFGQPPAQRPPTRYPDLSPVRTEDGQYNTGY